MGWLFAVAILFLALLWSAIWLRRRAIRALLLTTGAQTKATSSLYLRGRRSPRIALRYTDNAGTERTVIKSLVSAGDSQLLKKEAVVLYHPKRASRSDYILVGFGSHPQRWFPVEFAPSATDDRDQR
ncbi:hypothetical protein [Salinibacterium sp. M195]|uniref:hypothetical protein n=1 Tax=Salinibacterium sp. M195 TaxID=2583374 RepID=UPI001C635ED5|nr:hypothetical protein [Salinibacterium sp. M195]QYH36232.1 hypothetical protein FFT87_09845 [Salinibacterium sp. M195]